MFMKKKKLSRCEKMSKEGKYERPPLAWRCRIDLEKPFGFAVRNHNFPAGAESIILSNQRQKYLPKGSGQTHRILKEWEEMSGNKNGWLDPKV